jgi:hypothetical protein
MKYDKNLLGMESVLENNKVVSFSPETWKKLFDLDWEGRTYYDYDDTSIEEINKATFLREITKSSVPLGSPTNVPVSSLKVEDRMLFWVQSKILDPKHNNHGTVNSEDLCLLWILWNKKKINWSKFFNAKMLTVGRSKTKMIRYCSQIGVFLNDKKLLKDVPLHEPIEENGFSKRTVHKMHYYEDIVREEIVEWYYRPSRKSMLKVYDDRVVQI